MAAVDCSEMKEIGVLDACLRDVREITPERTTDAHVASRIAGWWAGYKYATSGGAR